MMNTSITSELVTFLLDARPTPTPVKTKAIDHIIDGIGLMLAGSRRPCTRKVVEYVREVGGSPASTLLGFAEKAPTANAALANGTSGHADDYDDTQLSTSPDRIYGLLTHPTVPVLAAALAVGEAVGCSGAAFLDAFVAGFEVECKLAEAIKPAHYQRGFHTTGTIGAFGACAAASRLFALTEEELRHALGITASLSSGIRVNFGTMTKPLHAGMASSNGVVACTLAGRGFEADANALDGRWGYLAILGGGSDSEKIVGKLGRPYAILDPGASIKMYPCGSLGQPSMDALLEIVTEENLQPEDVRAIRLRAGPNILEPLRYARPINALQAKFSLQFGLACVLVHRRAGLREYTEDVVRSAAITAAIDKVTTIVEPDLATKGMDRMRSIVEVELRDGRQVVRIADTARGTPEKPLNAGDLHDKFVECAGFVLRTDDTERLYSRLTAIADASSVTDITADLAG
jgi:2-methylcitrate dehydratase PrpD